MMAIAKMNQLRIPSPPPYRLNPARARVFVEEFQNFGSTSARCDDLSRSSRAPAAKEAA